MKTHDVEVKLRSEVKKGPNRRLRETGRCSAVFYGPEIESIKLSMNIHDFKQIMHNSRAGENSLLNMKFVDDSGHEDMLALIREVQYNPITDEVMHVDLLHVYEGYETTFPIGLEFTGEAEGVRFGGLLAPMLFTVNVKANPVNAPDHIEVDVSDLNIGDSVYAGDLDVGDLKLQIADRIPLVTVVPPKLSAALDDEEEEEVEGEEGAEVTETAGESEAAK